MATSRIQLALNVADIEAATRFYADMFGVPPAKQRPGYANFVVADPPLKLVLFENAGAASPLNHLGVEVASTADVLAATGRFTDAGLAHTTAEVDACCHAVQDKAWVEAPDVPLGAWEFYAVLDDDPTTEPGIDRDVLRPRIGRRHPLLRRQCPGGLRWSPRQPLSTWSDHAAGSAPARPGRNPGRGEAARRLRGPGGRPHLARSHWSRRHSAALVKLLALTPGRSLHREQVIDALWPDLGIDHAAPRLHKAAHYARKALGHRDAVVLNAETVRLCPDDDVHIDGARFQQLRRVSGRRRGHRGGQGGACVVRRRAAAPGPLRAVGRTAPATPESPARRAAAPVRGLAPGPGR